MFQLMSKKTFVITMASLLLIIVGIVGYRAARGQAGPEALPEGAIAIPADLAPKVDKYIETIKAAQKDQAALEQIYRVTLDRAGVAPEKFSEYRFDEAKKALVKASRQ